MRTKINLLCLQNNSSKLLKLLKYLKKGNKKKIENEF